MDSSHFINYLPITSDNKLKLFIDGKDYCADLFKELERAKRVIFLTGLHFMGDFKLIRTGQVSDENSRLDYTLARAAGRGVKIFLLVNQFWKDEAELNKGKTAPIRNKIMKAGELNGYLPETTKLFTVLQQFRNITCRTDIHPNSDVFGTNHQKTVVIDDRIAFLGGIDLTYLDGDRWDTSVHIPKLRAFDRTQKFWHDIHMRVEGPATEFVRSNFVERWYLGNLHILKINKKGLQGVKFDKNRIELPLPLSPYPEKYIYPSKELNLKKSWVQIVRSMPRREIISLFFGQPIWNKSNEDWDHSCKDAYIKGIRLAKKYIYLENQWVADEDIWAELAKAAKRNSKNPDFRIILMVPYEGLFAAGLGSNQELFIGAEMESIIDKSYNKGTFGMYSLIKKYGAVKSAQIYVHSKILIVDDEWALIGSANAGGISLEGIRGGRDQPDTELSAIIVDKDFVSSFRKQLWEEHLELEVSKSYSVKEADQFRNLAGVLKSKIRFFPGYDNIRRGVRSWAAWFERPGPKILDLKPYQKHSRIVSSFLPDLKYSLPLTLMRASFQAHISPAIPAGYRAWYRWICVFNTPQGEKRYRLLSLKYDKDEVFKYSDQSSVYIGKKSAEEIHSYINTDLKAEIRCRIQIIAVDESPDNHINGIFPSIVLKYDCLFLNETFAKHNMDLSLLPR